MSFENVSVKLVECVDDAAELMRWLGERRPVLGFDTETEGLHFWRQRVRLVQFGDANTGWAVPFERWSGVVEEVFRKYDRPIVGHNSRFDVRFLAHEGITVDQRQLHDTMLAANALWPDQRLALKTLAVRRLDPHAADGEHLLQTAMAKNRWTWATVPVDLPAYWAYGALDAVLSARLYEHMQPLLDAEAVRPVYELECAVSRVLFKLEMRGAHIDVPYCAHKYDELIAYATNLRAWCMEQFGVAPGNTSEVIRYLKDQGVDFTKLTKGGKVALDEEVLSAIEHPLAKTVLYVRKSEKIAATYFRNFLDLVDDGGNLHCSVRQVGAKTGRMSITEPALQTLPAENKIVRQAFVPSDGLHKLVSIDYRQIEMRIFASFAREEEMLHRIRDLGLDMHDAVTSVLYHIPEGEPIPSHLRRIVKNANFAKVFGAGAKRFAITAGITEDEGVAFYSQYDAMFPGVKRFQREVEAQARERFLAEGRVYAREPGGRLHVADEDTIYKLVNYLVQGSAATVLKTKLVDLDAAGFGDYLVLPVHDEIIFDFPTDEAPLLSETAGAIMTDTSSFAVPLTVDISKPLDHWEKS